MKALILAGAQNSGKSKTIGKTKDKGFKRKLKHEFGRTLFSHKGKKLSVYSGSCQELNLFCHAQEVIDCTEERVEISKSVGSKMIVLPFTMRVNWQGQLNESCILKPMDWLRKNGIEVHLVHLSRESADGFGQMKALMRRLHAETIASRKDYRRQADELWKIFVRVYP